MAPAMYIIAKSMKTSVCTKDVKTISMKTGSGTK